MSEDEAAHEDRVTYEDKYKGSVIRVTASRRPGPGYRMDGIVTNESATNKKKFLGEGNKETGYLTKEDAIRHGITEGRRWVDANLG